MRAIKIRKDLTMEQVQNITQKIETRIIKGYYGRRKPFLDATDIDNLLLGWKIPVKVKGKKLNLMLPKEGGNVFEFTTGLLVSRTGLHAAIAQLSERDDVWEYINLLQFESVPAMIRGIRRTKRERAKRWLAV